MTERRFSWSGVLALLMLLGGSMPSFAGAPPEDDWGGSAASQAEAEAGLAEQDSAAAATTPGPEDLTRDLRDFGITGTPVFDFASETHATPADTSGTAAPTSFESPPERVIWNKTPIRITLPVGQERLVHFPADVRVGLPSPPPPGLRTQTIDGTVYWMANEAFVTTRVQIQELATGQVYLIDLQAEPGGATAPVWILRPRTTDPLAAESETQSGRDTPPQSSVTFVQLTRQAAQQLYAPRRLVLEVAGIHRVPVKTDPVPLVRGGKVKATPLIAWQGGAHYVTAVKLQNTTASPIILDPRELRGPWHAATFQQARLFPAGDEADTTCVYLISARPFAEALRGLY